jgi:hypothetical protein
MHQHNTSGRLPVVFAYSPLPDGQHAVVGEFDVDHISGMLRQAPGRVRVIDQGLRTIANTQGYLAFEELSESWLRSSAGDAFAGKVSAQLATTGSDPALVASAPVGRQGPVAALHWAVVADQTVAALNLPGNELRRRALVAGLLSAAVALLVHGWHEFLLLRPLHRTARVGQRLIRGDTKSVIYPIRQDQIGSITSCLEIFRQALTEGAHRLGDVRRPTAKTIEIRVRDVRVPVTVPPAREDSVLRES